MNIKQLKADAKRLRDSLSEAGLEVNHSQSLDLLAKSRGHADWNTLFAVLSRRYFYDRHESYLPNTAAEVRSLSIRRANLLDLADVEERKLEGEPSWATAFSRAAQQVRLAKKGVLRVAPTLQRALAGSNTSRESSLEQAEKSMDAAMGLLMRSRYADMVSPDENVKRAYHEAYQAWRVAALVDALHRLDKSDQPTFVELRDQGVNLFTYVGDLLATSPAKNPEEQKANRHVGKAMLLSYIACNDAEYALQVFNLPVEPAYWARMERKLYDRFPEIALWHAWAELKPVLADGVDDVKL